MPDTASPRMQCARQVVETIPKVMRILRNSVRTGRTALSVPQVRTLSFLSREPGASVSDVANYLEVTIPTASALVDRLVKRELVKREDDPSERRKVVLTLTQPGQKLLDEARSESQALLAQILTFESPEKLAAITQGLTFLAEAVTSFSDTQQQRSIKARVS